MERSKQLILKLVALVFPAAVTGSPSAPATDREPAQHAPAVSPTLPLSVPEWKKPEPQILPLPARTDSAAELPSRSIPTPTFYSSATFAAKVSETTRASSSEKVLSLAVPSRQHWTLLTDKTEREGGATEAELLESDEGMVFEGELGSIPSDRGPVGFAIARVPFDVISKNPSSTSNKQNRIDEPAFRNDSITDGNGRQLPVSCYGVSFILSADEPLVYAIVVTMNTNPTTSYGANITYQKRITVGPSQERFIARWSELEAYARGRKLDQAPPLDPSKIDTIGLQITRSTQTSDNQIVNPLHFSLVIHGAWLLATH